MAVTRAQHRRREIPDSEAEASEIEIDSSINKKILTKQQPQLRRITDMEVEASGIKMKRSQTARQTTQGHDQTLPLSFSVDFKFDESNLKLADDILECYTTASPGYIGRRSLNPRLGKCLWMFRVVLLEAGPMTIRGSAVHAVFKINSLRSLSKERYHRLNN